MKVALINPGSPQALRKENLGLAYLAAALDAAGHDTRILDEVAGQDVASGLDAFRPDAVGISSMTMYVPRAYALADEIRAKRGIPVILGGAHPTALPHEAIQHADCVIRGEGEETLVRVVDSGRIEGIVEPAGPRDLDELPFPARDKLDLEYYAAAGDEIAGLSYRTLGIITSRGCPFVCNFCINSKREERLRFHSPDRVMEEIRYLVTRHRIESIAFYDEMIGTNSLRFSTICERMIEEGFAHLKWECQLHVRAIRPDVLSVMKRAGCVQVAIGFETGSQRVLDRISKNATVELNLEATRRVREAGLRVRGCFIIGTPGETVEDIAETERFIREAPIDFVSMHYLTPYPGTAVYDEVKDRLEAAAIPWDRFTTGDPDTFLVNTAIPADVQRRAFERLRAQAAFRNYSIGQMVHRTLKNPHHAIHILKSILKK